MIYPSDFYYSVSKSQKSYHTAPVGQPDIIRSIEREDFWMMPESESARLPKTLIFHQPDTSLWTPEYTFQTIQLIQQCLKDGFNVYLWQNNELQPVDFQSVAGLLLDIRVQNNLKHTPLQKKISEIAAIHKLSSDATMILSIEQLFNYLQDQSYSEPLLYTKTFNEDFLETDDVYSNLAVLRLELSSNQAQQKKAVDITKLFVDIPKLTQTRIETVSENPEEIAFFFRTIKSVGKGTSTMTELTLKFIQISSSTLFEILMMCPKLRTLSIIDCTITHDLPEDWQAPPDFVKSLENVTLTIAINPLILSIMLNMHHIKKLDINATRNKDVFCGIFIERLNPSQLASLEVFSYISNQSLDARLLDKLTYARKLEEFYLNICCTGYRIIPSSAKCIAKHLPHLSFPNLKSFTWLNIAFDISFFFKGAIQLETLQIGGCEFILPYDTSFNHLKQLEMNNIVLDTPFFEKLLQDNQQLESIKLSSCQCLQTLRLHQNSLPAVKELKFQEIDITQKNLETFFKACPNLKVFDATYMDADISIEKALKKCANFKSLQILEDQRPKFAIETYKSQSHLQWDADTKPKDTSFTICKIFHSLNPVFADPNASFYRVNVFNQLNLLETQCHKNEAFTLKQTGNLQLRPVSLEPLPIDQIVYQNRANITLDLNAGQWQSLPSLSPNDRIYTINLPEDVELQYSDRDQLYYVRCQHDKRYDCQFDLFYAPIICTELQSDILALIQEINAFQEKELEYDTKQLYTGIEWMDALCQQKVGACRHRAMVFKYLMEQRHADVPCRIVSNTCHAFVEINVNRQWLIFDLGGYPAQIKYVEQLPSTSETSSTPWTAEHELRWSAVEDYSEQELTVTKIFQSLDEQQSDSEVETYRMDIYQCLKLDEHLTGPNCFELSQDNELDLQDVIITAQEKGYQASITLDLKANQWHPLPSMTPYEQIYDINLPPHIQLKYSKKNQLYFIQSNQNEAYACQYKITCEQPQAQAIPKDIQELITQLQQFEKKPLAYDSSYDYTGLQYIDLLMQEQIGSSRQRAVILKNYLDTHHPHLNSRIITNQCHVFVEAQINEIWTMFDLGDKPTLLHIEEPEPIIDFPELRELSKKVFSNWIKEKQVPLSPSNYLMHCIHNQNINKLLIESDCYEQNKAIYRLFLSHKSSLCPMFYIDSPDDIKCASIYMKKFSDGHGELQPGPGGALHDFLTSYEHGVLLINYAHFKPSDLVKYNALLDDTRRADGTSIPTKMKIIGLITTDRPTPGNDFYSRFDQTQICPIDSKQIPKIPLPLVSLEQIDRCQIEFFHSKQWKMILLGNWYPSSKGWQFIEGQFTEAYKQGQRKFEWRNAPWHDAEFVQFYENMILSGHLAEVPIKEIELSIQDGYNWQQLSSVFRQSQAYSQENIRILNPLTLSQFFQSYSIEEPNLVQKPGIFQIAKDTLVTLLLTYPLSEHDWAKLLHEASSYSVQIDLLTCGDVLLPETLQHIQKIEFNPLCNTPHTIMIETNDRDKTVNTIGSDIVLHIDECNSCDLISHIHLEIKDLHFQFRETISALKYHLDQGQTVVLTGQFSDELAMELEPFILKRFQEQAPVGRLYGIFSSLPLKFITPNQNIFDQAETLCIEMAKKAYQSAFPDKDSHHAWLGLKELPFEHLIPDIDLTNSEQKSIEFFSKREQSVINMLQHAPYVFIAGLSGVGKTSFIRHELVKNQEVYLFQSEDEIKHWAHSTSPGLNILFLDEANLSQKKWTEFEGLFNTPPGILINGEYVQLTSQHKVIFAGNPVNYGDERHLSPLFERHGNAIIFDPIPGAVIYEKILKPVFLQISTEVYKSICQHILEAYKFICKCSTGDVLISPRELQMITLLVKNYLDTYPASSVEYVTKYFTYQLTKNLIPLEHQERFNEDFFAPDVLESSMILPHFFITPSRENCKKMLEQFLSLRITRRKPEQPEIIQYGGLGGLVLEGPPGIGKTELVTNCLIALGYRLEHNFETPKLSELTFFKLPINMDLDSKQKLLLNAFDQGAIVVIDEMNSSPMMERLLNDLLMGHSPSGKSASKPGFLVIGTQNPISMAGRRVVSTALLRRMLTIELPDYTADELLNILQHRGLETTEAKAIIDEFIKKVNEASQNRYEPAPTFRDLLKFVKSHQKAQSCVEQEEEQKHDLMPNPICLELLTITQSLKEKTKGQHEIEHIEDRLNQVLYTSTTHDCLHEIIQQLQKYSAKKSPHPIWQDSIQARLELILKQLMESQTVSKQSR